MLRRVLHVAAIALLLIQLGGGQTPADVFQRGNELYRGGSFEKAIREYEQILKEGYVSAPLYFNLGNTYYRLGKVAPAILSYERAARLDPNDPDIEHNLTLANFKIVDRIESLPDFFLLKWLRDLQSYFSLTASVSFFLLCWILFFLSLALFFMLKAPGLLRTLRWVAVVSGVLLVPSTAVLLAQVVASRSHDEAILMEKVITAKTSPDEQSVDAFVVHEGLKVKVGDSVGDWVKITLADGKVGWIRADQCERI